MYNVGGLDEVCLVRVAKYASVGEWSLVLVTSAEMVQMMRDGEVMEQVRVRS